MCIRDRLIARFAKTFDIVYENLDANFKVAFARVVLKGGTHELVPPPFNLVRRVVLLLYAVISYLWTALRCPRPTRSSRASFTPLVDDAGDDELNAHGLSGEEVSRIYEFLRKASSPEVRLYPQIAEQWTMRHQHDVASEDRWRTAITQQIAALHTQLANSELRKAKALGAAGTAASPDAKPPDAKPPHAAGGAETLSSLEGRISQMSADLAAIVQELRPLMQGAMPEPSQVRWSQYSAP